MNCVEYLFHLVKSALLDDIPQELPDNVSWNEIFELSEKHMIANIVWFSINKLNFLPDDELWKKWTDINYKATIKDVIQKKEFNSIISILEKNRIRCLPVKGIFLKDYYPRSEFRTMSDIDIYIDFDNIKNVTDILVERGYELVAKGGHHDVFIKKPVMCIEVHKFLIAEQFENLHQYYSDVFLKSNLIDGYQYVYTLNDIDFFIYVIAHFYKHFSEGGSGIRSVLDVYILNHNLLKKVNRDEFRFELEKIKLTDFYDQVSALGESWFGDSPMDSNLIKSAEFIIGSGVYGNYNNVIKQSIAERGKFGYFIYCVFLPLKLMKVKYPVLKKFPFLLPFFWIYRIIKSSRKKGKKIFSYLFFKKN